MDTSQDRPCFVYLLRAGNAVKIGIAVNIGARLAALQSGNPLPIEIVGRRRFPNTLAALEAERSLHKRFCDQRAQGEWFRISTEAATDALNNLGAVPCTMDRPEIPAVKQDYPAFDFGEQMRLARLAEFYTEA